MLFVVVFGGGGGGGGGGGEVVLVSTSKEIKQTIQPLVAGAGAAAISILTRRILSSVVAMWRRASLTQST